VTDQSYSSVIQADGTLGPWSPAGSILHARMHAGSFAAAGNVFVLGGFDGSSRDWSDVVSAAVNPDGTLGPWVNAGALPQNLSHFSLSLVGRWIYLAGGLNQSALNNPPLLTSVYAAPIDANGFIGSWIDQTPLPTGLGTHASFFYGGRLYVAGGINSTPAQEKRVWSAPIGADGMLGAWQPEAPLPVARGHVHQLPIYLNHVYSVAGAIDFNLNSTSEIDVGTFQ
jgi:N-acetylneuraminic acid mutarotase